MLSLNLNWSYTQRFRNKRKSGFALKSFLERFFVAAKGAREAEVYSCKVRAGCLLRSIPTKCQYTSAFEFFTFEGAMTSQSNPREKNLTYASISGKNAFPA